MKIGIRFGPCVLLSDVGAELNVLGHGFPEEFVVGKACLVECLEVQSYESGALIVRDPKVSVDVDDVLETKFTRDAIWTTE